MFKLIDLTQPPFKRHLESTETCRTLLSVTVTRLERKVPRQYYLLSLLTLS